MGSSEPPNSDYDDLYNVQITSPLVDWDCSLLYKKFSLYDFPPGCSADPLRQEPHRCIQPTILGRTVHIESRSPLPARKLAMTYHVAHHAQGPVCIDVGRQSLRVSAQRDDPYLLRFMFRIYPFRVFCI